jgi:hypothetical protein
LYLDDIQDIHAGVADFSRQWLIDNPESTHEDKSSTDGLEGLVEIRAQNATADSIEDLKDATRRELNHVSLICKSPKIRIDLWLRNAVIIAESDSASVRSFTESLSKFIYERKNYAVILLAAQTSAYLTLSALIAWIIIAILLPVPNEFKIYPNTLTDIALAGFIGVAFYVVFRQYTSAIRVAPEWRREHRGLSSRTVREIIVAVIGGIVVGLLGLWAGLLIHH